MNEGIMADEVDCNKLDDLLFLLMVLLMVLLKSNSKSSLSVKSCNSSSESNTMTLFKAANFNCDESDKDTDLFCTISLLSLTFLNAVLSIEFLEFFNAVPGEAKFESMLLLSVIDTRAFGSGLISVINFTSSFRFSVSLLISFSSSSSSSSSK
ncbi:unnamed protein product [[Candida] boidinii]|nr:unnamed protein product [[Candida] boidinii]